MIETNPLQPLVDALLAARRPDGTWPEPLDWLAREVLEPCTELPFDPVALHWTKGWAYGMGRYWLESMLPPHCNTDWAGRLGMMLDDPLDTDRNLAALVEAVKAIMEVQNA